MIPEAALQIRHPENMLSRLAGLTVIERQLFTLARAGVKKAWVNQTRPAGLSLRLPEGMDVFWEISPESRRLQDGARRPIVSGDHLFRMEALKSILSNYSSPQEHFLGQLSSETFPRAMGPGERRNSLRQVSLTETHAKKISWLLNGARKNEDGFMARYFDRRLSLRATRWLLDTRLSPNDMTLISTGIGLAGALQFLLIGRIHELFGASLIWLHTVLDGCDGEMARLTFRESRWGAFLDFWGDNAVHAALFACLALNLAYREPHALIYGALACLGALGSAWLMFGNPPQGNDHLEKIEAALAQRDFIYLLVLSAIVNRTDWFLRAAGVGAPLYFLLSMHLHRANHQKLDLDKNKNSIYNLDSGPQTDPTEFKF